VGLRLLPVKAFANSGDEALARASMPVLKESIRPIESRFGFTPTDDLYAQWRPDRLEALSIIENMISSKKYSHVLFLKIRKLLRNRAAYDPDVSIKETCEALRVKILDSLDLRVARVLTSWAHDEIKVGAEQESDSYYKAAEKEWAAFRSSVARELVERFKSAQEICDYIRTQIRELRSADTSFSGFGGALLEPIAEISPEWCAELLKEIIASEDAALDGFLWPVIQRGAITAKEAYRKAVEFLPVRGRPEQLCSLVNFLGWNQLHGGGLDPFEWESLSKSTKRTESPIVHALATIAGLHLESQPDRAMETLCQLQPNDESAADSILSALGRLAEKQSARLDSILVAQCLSNVGRFCFPQSISDERSLENVAEKFPKQVYEHIRMLHEQAEAGPERRWGRAETAACRNAPARWKSFIR